MKIDDEEDDNGSKHDVDESDDDKEQESEVITELLRDVAEENKVVVQVSLETATWYWVFYVYY